MNGTLIKYKDCDYTLMVGNHMYAFTNVPKGLDYRANKLSIKNCQSIENGYDLDEMIESSKNDLVHANNSESLYYSRGVYYGFQKALELLGDKKFSRQDVIHALTYGVGESKKNRTHSQILEEYRNVHLQQQNEWDVSFNPDEKDSEGCLILKIL